MLLGVHSEEQKKEGETMRLIHGATVVAMRKSMNSFSQLLLKLGDQYLLVFARTTEYMESLCSGPASFNARY